MRAVVKLTIPAQKCGCPPEDGIAAVLRDSLHLPNTTAATDSGLALPNSTADPDSGLALPNTTASPYPELSLPNTTAGPNQDADLENIAVASGKNPCQNNGSTAIVP